MDRAHFNSDDQPAPKESRPDLRSTATYCAEHRVILIADRDGFTVVPQREAQSHAVRARVARIGRSGTLFRLTWADQRLLCPDYGSNGNCATDHGDRNAHARETTSASADGSSAPARTGLRRWLQAALTVMREVLHFRPRRNL